MSLLRKIGDHNLLFSVFANPSDIVTIFSKSNYALGKIKNTGIRVYNLNRRLRIAK